jgi:NAD(P)-dependent dehydrogenase (short-subunit alcohol dehydrogenase family)
MDQERKVAVVTGGASALGREIALRLAADGYAVCVLDSDAGKGNETVKAVDAVTKGIFVEYDAARHQDAPEAMETAYKALGRIDVLVNAAEVLGKCPAEEVTSEAFDHVMNVNVKSTLFTAIAAAAFMKKNESGGCIVNISSIQGRIAIGEHVLYSASKGAVIAMTRELAVDLSPYNIKCNSLATWAVDTPETLEELDDPEMREQVLSSMLLDRLIKPEDVSEVVSFLVSENSYCINGFDLALDAGMTTFRIRPEFSYFEAEGKNYYN